MLQTIDAANQDVDAGVIRGGVVRYEVRTLTRFQSAEEIAAQVSSLGSRFKMNDSPWIPFDDYYTREDFSWIRLEVLDESGVQALELLA